MDFVALFVFFLMIRRPPISTRTVTLLPYPTLFRSGPLRSSASRPSPLHPVPPICGGGEFRKGLPVTHPHPIRSAPEATTRRHHRWRSAEHTSELQSLMRI